METVEHVLQFGCIDTGPCVDDQHRGALRRGSYLKAETAPVLGTRCIYRPDVDSGETVSRNRKEIGCEGDSPRSKADTGVITKASIIVESIRMPYATEVILSILEIRQLQVIVKRIHKNLLVVFVELLINRRELNVKANRS